jgi:hypothetical protein
MDCGGKFMYAKSWATQHNDTQYNDTKLNDTQHNCMLH